VDFGGGVVKRWILDRNCYGGQRIEMDDEYEEAVSRYCPWNVTGPN
jgi:hypothetical protein